MGKLKAVLFTLIFAVLLFGCSKKKVTKNDTPIITTNVYTKNNTTSKLEKNGPYTVYVDYSGCNVIGQISTSFITDEVDSRYFNYNVMKAGYAFKGWSCAGERVFDENGMLINNITMYEGMTFYPTFEKLDGVTLHITYAFSSPKTGNNTYYNKQDLWGDISETHTYSNNTNVSLTANLNEGYSFDGWYLSGKLLSKDTNFEYMMCDESIIICAHISMANYQMIIDTNNYELGKIMFKFGNSQTWYNEYTLREKYTSTVTVAAKTIGEERFVGWFDTSNNLVSTDMVFTFDMPNYDYYLQARWNLFNISYDLNDGENNIDNPITYNVDMDEILLKDPIKEGHTFLGWYINGEKVDSIDPNYSSDLLIVASWQVNNYLLIINNEEEGVIIDGAESGIKYDYGTELVLTANNIPDYMMASWCVNNEYTHRGDTYSFSFPAKDLTIVVTIYSVNYKKQGSSIYFGSYPQTLETDSSMISSLNSRVGSLPNSNSNGKWTDYGYKYQANAYDYSSYIWYIDIDYDNDGDFDYRGVFFRKSRPNIEDANYWEKSYNGFDINTVYWFKYEPIKWNICEEKDGTVIMISELVLDNQVFLGSSNKDPFEHNGARGYASNYALSNLRRWLNDSFYSTAFNDLEKEIINLTIVKNSKDTYGTHSGDSVYDYNNFDTEDYVFLVSYKEKTDYKTGTYATCSSYSKVMGVSIDNSDDSTTYILRSPYSPTIILPSNENKIITGRFQVRIPNAIRPAITIAL